MQDSPHVSLFDAIRKRADDGSEYWPARELSKVLGFTAWCNFNNTVIARAMKSCEENGQAVSDHFVQSYKPIKGGKGSTQEVNASYRTSTDILA